MNKFTVSKKIRALRREAGLTQKELAEGICTQAQISNIEKGELSPSSAVLYQISKKLNVDLNYFFDIKHAPQKDPAQPIKDLMRKYIRQRDYHSLLYIVTNEKDKPLFKKKDNQQFLLWHEAICDYYLNKDRNKAIDKLEKAVKLTNTTSEYYSEREIEILNSIAIIHTEEKNYENASYHFKEALKYIDFLSHLENKNIKIRILYGLSKCLTDMKEFEESLLYCKIGKELCIENETLYLLGELLYQYGKNLIKLGRFETAEEMLNKSIMIFDIQNNYPFIEIINQMKKNIPID